MAFYGPPQRGAFRATILRALRDPNGVVFPAATVNDFINEALMDMSSYRPHDTLRTMAWEPTTWEPEEELMTGVSEVWQVIAREGDGPLIPTLFIPYVDYADGRAGWDVVNHNLRLSRLWVYRLQQMAQRSPDTTLTAWGYGDLAFPTADDTYLDFHGATDQYCATQHCKMLGFQMLNADRALYQQWLAATNNTDVSPTQLQGMLGQAEVMFDRARGRNSIIRRRPSNVDVRAL